MVLLDTNVLIAAHKRDATRHAEASGWLTALVASGERFAIPELCANGFLRIVTHPKVFDPPTEPNDAFRFLEGLHEQPGYMPCTPGDRHWTILRELCRTVKVRGNLFTDAWLAALAIEAGATMASADTDFGDFPGLRWTNPTKPERS